jgi:hypothetical protein
MASPARSGSKILDSGAVRPESAGHIVAVMRRRAWRPSRPCWVEVEAACFLVAWPECGNRGNCTPLAPFGGTGAAEGVLARFGPYVAKSVMWRWPEQPLISSNGRLAWIPMGGEIG